MRAVVQVTAASVHRRQGSAPGAGVSQERLAGWVNHIACHLAATVTVTVSLIQNLTHPKTDHFEVALISISSQFVAKKL